MRETSFVTQDIDWQWALSWFGSTASRLQSAIFSAFLLFFILFGLKVLLRREWAAAMGTALFLAVQSSANFTSSNPLLDGLAIFVVGCAIGFVLLRFGLLASIVAVFVLNSVGSISLSSNLSAWYAPYDIATLLLIAALACLAFLKSLGQQTLVEDHPKI